MTDKKATADSRTTETELSPEDLYKQITTTENSLKGLHRRTTTTENSLRDLHKRIDKIEEMLDPRTLEKAKADAKSIHDLYGVTHLKHCVATETAFLARKESDILLAEKLALAAVRAFDLPDRWWLEKRDYTLAVWQKILLDIYTHGLPEVDPEEYKENE